MKKKINWENITDKDVENFYNKIIEMAERNFERDGDDDLPIDIYIINRSKKFGGGFIAVPYSHKDFEGYKKIVEYNLSVAMGMFETLRKLETLKKEK